MSDPTRLASSITIRRIQLKPSATTPEYWFGDRAFETHFFNALSSTFPEGERFFIRAVRAFSERLDDETLLAEVSAFVGQEGQHSREHDAHVQMLIDQGYVGIATMNRAMSKVMNAFIEYLPRYSLAITCAIEHITATLARLLINDDDAYLEPMAPEMRVFWHWHACEELEHKSVAFDVYMASGGDFPLRALAMVQVALGFFVEIFVRHVYLLWKDGAIADADEWRRGSRFLLGHGGLVTALWSGMKEYFSRDFHPTRTAGDRDMVAAFEAKFGEHLA